MRSCDGNEPSAPTDQVSITITPVQLDLVDVKRRSLSRRKRRGTGMMDSLIISPSSSYSQLKEQRSTSFSIQIMTLIIIPNINP
ncbi:unnamed protein product [Mycena citricolor]|uniref:Uncharacterized protein n=1 Tax=Mycena citricolor TaxID=2018698 RepID=A0AAD2HXM7_9AGAR|nr:unnamed protein product [Mycena citricolor]CAK5283186.1 unnamed protein product [Mycena citricolor]